MPRKRVAGLLVTVLIGASIGSAHAAAPKPGLVCKKLGKTQISNSIKYTCVKSGSRLVWNKGIRITKTASTPTQDVWESTVWYQNTKAISLESRDNSFELKTAKKMISPNFDQSIANGLLEYTQIAANYWNRHSASIPSNLEIAMFTEKDQSWFTNNVGISAPVVETFFNRSDANIYFNGTVIIDRIPANRFVIVYFVGTEYKGSTKYLSTTSNWRTALATMATHEFQHLVQFTKTLTTNKGNLQAKLPCWFNEGMAAFYEDSLYLEAPGNSQSQKYLQEWLDTRNEVLKIRQKRIQFLTSNVAKYGVNADSLADWKTFIVANYSQQSDGCTNSQYGYTLGRFMLEKLYIDFGTKKIVELLADFQNSTDFDISFNNIFGSTPQDWLSNVGIPYFLIQKTPPR